MEERMTAPASLRQLRTFVAICDFGGVVRAATKLHLSQPAASRQIHALEADLGVALFDRVGRRMRLTAEGEDLLARSRRVLFEFDSLGERARVLKGGEGGVLRVGATPQVIENVLATFLTRYRTRHPATEVQLVEDGGARLAVRLKRGDVALAILPEGDEGLERRLLYPMLVVAAIPASHKLARRSTIEIHELAGESLLVLGRDFASRHWFDAACQVARVRPRLLFGSAVPQTLLALASEGHGVAVVPTPVVVRDARLRALPLVHRGAPIGRWAAVAWDARRYLAPQAASFVEELAAAVARDYPGREIVRRAPQLSPPAS
jgi:DNA-binding transcriptional LysR family regulator